MKEKTTQNLEEQFPSIELAYPIAINSYDVAIKRLDLMDGRLQTLLAFVVTVTAGFVTLAANQGTKFMSFWFFLGIACFVACVLAGLYGRLAGDIALLRPKNLFIDWLSNDRWTFQKDIIYDAGENFEHNMGLARFRWLWSVKISLAFAVEVLCLSVWVLVSRP